MITPTALSILEELWRDQYDGGKRGLTSHELAVNLKLSVVAVNTALHHLKDNLGLINSHGSTPTRGRPATMYMIDGNRVITWPVSAILILHLFDREAACCSKHGLQEYMLSQALLDPYTNKPYEPFQIENVITFSEAKGYIAKIPDHPDMFVRTQMAIDQWPYLDMVKRVTLLGKAARHAGSKPPAS